MPIQGAEQKQSESPETDGWKLLFSTLLQTALQDLDFTIDATNNTLVINTQNQNSVKKLASILKSPNTVRASLNYTLQEAQANNVAVIYPEACAFEITPSQVKIDKNQLIAYLSAIFKEGFILHVQNDKTLPVNNAFPICFNSEHQFTQGRLHFSVTKTKEPFSIACRSIIIPGGFTADKNNYHVTLTNKPVSAYSEQLKREWDSRNPASTSTIEKENEITKGNAWCVIS